MFIPWRRDEKYWVPTLMQVPHPPGETIKKKEAKRAKPCVIRSGEKKWWGRRVPTRFLSEANRKETKVTGQLHRV